MDSVSQSMVCGEPVVTCSLCVSVEVRQPVTLPAGNLVPMRERTCVKSRFGA